MPLIGNPTRRPARHTRPLALIAGSLATIAALSAGCATDTDAHSRPASPGAMSAETPSKSGIPAADLASASSPIRDALVAADPDVRTYNDHVTFLANPYLAGRLPGTRGIEIAEDYIAWNFDRLGLTPAFTASDGSPSWFQEFEAGADVTVRSAGVSLAGSATLLEGTDFNVLGNSGSGSINAPLVFVGYAIEDGNDGYDSFGDADLSGKIAVVARFEPMDENGDSLWASSGWSNNAALNGKFNAVAAREPSGVIFVTPPKVNDERAGRLEDADSIGGGSLGVPVVHMTPEALDTIVRKADTQGRSLQDLIDAANAGGGAIDLPAARVSMNAQVTRDPIIARNVGAMIPGRGELADEIIVIGGHHDHVGRGFFGSRSSFRGEIHEGADDNASGTAGVLLAAELLASRATMTDADTPRRSVLLMTFSAEESGLNGARHYVTDPLGSPSQHTMMINMDMIGRIENDRLSVSGTKTAAEFDEILPALFEASGLEIVKPTDISGRSDHYPFYRAGIPVLFGIIADFHEDYHTPADESWKINRTAATKTARLFADIAEAVALRPGGLTYTGSTAAEAASAPPMGSVKVRFGISPASYDTAGQTGIAVGDVFPGTSAAEAGIRKGDRIVEWDGKPVLDVNSWMPFLFEAEPGDVVDVTVMREGEKIVLPVTLQARGSAG